MGEAFGVRGIPALSQRPTLLIAPGQTRQTEILNPRLRLRLSLRRDRHRPDHPGAFTGRASGRRVPDQMVDIVLQLRAAHLQFFDFLVRREINLFLDAIDGIIEPMIFIEHFAEVVVRAFETADDLTVFRKFPEDRMMKVHSFVFRLVAE